MRDEERKKGRKERGLSRSAFEKASIVEGKAEGDHEVRRLSAPESAAKEFRVHRGSSPKSLSASARPWRCETTSTSWSRMWLRGAGSPGASLVTFSLRSFAALGLCVVSRWATNRWSAEDWCSRWYRTASSTSERRQCRFSLRDQGRGAWRRTHSACCCFLK